MPANILTTGTAAADSSDVVVASGSTLTVALKDVAGPSVSGSAKVNVFLKDDAGQYFLVDELTGAGQRAMVISAGTWRFSRVAGESCGVFSA